ncbi:MAG TPA: phenylacetate--CoA ligase, partial [Methylomirabilota bacterium]|nr:phenylacetate--CoA ligase [Methylomirabilota bacterium]
GALDTLEERVEERPEVAGAGDGALRDAALHVRRRVHEVIGLTVDVTALRPRTLERAPGKACRVQDLRAQGGGA